MRELRDYQQSAIDALRASLASGHKRVVMQGPTGFGKTVLAGEMISSARSKGKRVLFTVPAISLVDQTVESFYAHGIDDIGVIQANHIMTDWSKPVQIASVQTLQRRDAPPEADLVVVDECHKWFRYYEKWMLEPVWQKVPFIGMSATPWTKGLKSYYTDWVRATTIQELIDRGYLSPFKVFSPTHPDLAGVRTVAGDYHEGDLSEAMSNKFLVADVVQTWLNKAERRPTLCFAVDRDHAKLLQERFEAAGVKTAYQDALTTTEERAAIRRGFHDGSIEVVVNIGTLTTGVDWDVRCISLCRPTKSEMLFVQIIGRGLRLGQGKDHCLILDHSDNHLRLGFVTEVEGRHHGLIGGKTDANENSTGDQPIRLPKECPQCHYLKPPRVAKCPNCGFIAEKVELDGVEERAGELKELKPASKSESGKHTMEEKSRFLGGLRGYAKQKGYADGWASHKFKEKFGVWPDHTIAGAPAVAPAPEILSWVKSRQIAWAKSKRNPSNSGISAAA